MEDVAMRSSGVLMHISSLPSCGGIGMMGKEARAFVDFLEGAKQAYWQILPICPTSYGDSPYQSFSTFAGNPYLIDFEELEKEGLLYSEEYRGVDWESTEDSVNFGVLYQKCYPILRKAVQRFLQNPKESFYRFCEEQADWLEDYALFMTIKDLHQGLPWLEWEEALRSHDAKALNEVSATYSEEVNFWKVVQYFFFSQWDKLRTYANEKGVQMIGDLPIYVALDSVDVWAHPQLFQLDENRNPIEVAGCPPDGFSATGQLWGNPLFDWDEMEKNHYQWWIHRIHFLCQVYNVLRIDHFRGFDSYYAIPYGSVDAKNGSWKIGPGMKLFRALEQAVGRQRIIAEDLGFLTDSVRQLLKESGFPGMKVLQFAFDHRDTSNSEYLPYHYSENCVAYIGTHDNDTVQGWFGQADERDLAYAKEYLRLQEPSQYHWEMLQELWSSPAGLTIVQAQDLLGLGSESRMNTPSTIGQNWKWRAIRGSFDETLQEKLKHVTQMYGRA